jgi:hypothetical protein
MSEIEEIKNESNESNKSNKSNKTIEVTPAFLKNIKAVMDIASQRIHWKSDELYPVGTVMKELSDYLKVD